MCVWRNGSLLWGIWGRIGQGRMKNWRGLRQSFFLGLGSLSDVECVKRKGLKKFKMESYKRGRKEDKKGIDSGHQSVSRPVRQLI
jgi:hypothetical protein